MTERLQTDKPLVEAVYFQDHPNDPIELGEATVQYMENGISYTDVARFTLRFVPNDRLEFVVPLENKPMSLPWRFFTGESGDTTITFTDTGCQFEAFLRRVGEQYGGIVFTPKRSGIITAIPGATIAKATFHLFNFPDFFGPESYILKNGEPPNCAMASCGLATLKADGWTITIAATERTADLTRELNKSGGFALTHVGQIVREDGNGFTKEELDDVVECLQYYLSFVLGRWAGVTLAIGFDKNGRRVYEEWGMPRAASGSWNGSCSWFHDQASDLLGEVFPGFRSLWRSPVWHTPLVHALYWYLGACDRGVGIGVDTGIILAQTALELLAWNYCVQDRHMVSARAFEPRGLTAADKLRMLATALDIPKEIPPCLSALGSGTGKPGKKWDDALHAITALRNSVVHPNSQDHYPDNSYFEAWKLSMWHIDMILLRLCGHNGIYSNRLARMKTTESVPWASASAGKA